MVKCAETMEFWYRDFRDRTALLEKGLKSYIYGEKDACTLDKPMWVRMLNSDWFLDERVNPIVVQFLIRWLRPRQGWKTL